jgi:hypothetical protein
MINCILDYFLQISNCCDNFISFVFDSLENKYDFVTQDTIQQLINQKFLSLNADPLDFIFGMDFKNLIN